MSRGEVLGIGFQQTGTTTPGAIFDALGYRTASYHPFRDLAECDSVTWDEVEARALAIAGKPEAAGREHAPAQAVQDDPVALDTAPAGSARRQAPSALSARAA